MALNIGALERELHILRQDVAQLKRDLDKVKKQVATLEMKERRRD